MIKNIIFDLGRVIILLKNLDVEVNLSKLFKISLKSSYNLYKKYKRDLVIGNITTKELLAIFNKKYPTSKKINELFKEYKEKWFASDILKMDKELLTYINKLKQQYKTYIFTNTIDANDQYIFNKYKFKKYFLHIFKSHIDHIYKPEVQSYLYVVNKIKAKPGECVFIDDLEENIFGAKKAGLKGIVYKNLSQLTHDLEKIGVKI